jgi:hypothetical protein
VSNNSMLWYDVAGAWKRDHGSRPEGERESTGGTPGLKETLIIRFSRMYPAIRAFKTLNGRQLDRMSRVCLPMVIDEDGRLRALRRR